MSVDRQNWYDVVIVGAGPAGMAAALGAHENGARRVLVIDRDDRLGGILPQCIHAGFGVEIFDRELTGPEYAGEYISRLGQPGIETALDTTVLHIDRDNQLTLTSARSGIHRVSAGAVVLALGCRERTRHNIHVPGYRPAGVFTAGTAQRLMNLDGLMIGSRVVVVGSGDIGLIMARRCVLEGAEVPAVIEVLPHPSGLSRNVAQCLRDYDIPLYLNQQVTFIEGRERVSGVRFEQRDAGAAGEPVDGPDGRGAGPASPAAGIAPSGGSAGAAGTSPAAGTAGNPGAEQRLECDTLLFSVGLIPEIELASRLGIPLDPFTRGPVVDNAMQTRLSGVFACGNLVQVYDLVDWVSMDGYAAGRSAALSARGRLNLENGGLDHSGKASEATIEFDETIRSLAPQRLKPYAHLADTGTRLYVRMARALKKPVFYLKAGGETIGTINKPFAVPSEIVCLEIGPFLEQIFRAGGLRIEAQGEELVYTAQGESPDEITCVVCPFSCKVKIVRSEGGVETLGAACARGKRYALAEATDPRRVFTSTVRVQNGHTPRVSVRSSEPIRKEDWQRAFSLTCPVRVKAPVKAGQIIVEPFLEQGIKLVATRSVGAET
jgi:CxxC motif-containing protein/NADPH-dependent 2,4-dienoyl-CoA reductase/sulfur reductase-like enzyme